MVESKQQYDQRMFERQPILVEARIQGESCWYDCRISNISTGGAKLQVDQQIAHGEMVCLKIGDFGEFSATVCWQQSRELGVKFTHDPLEMADVVIGLATYGSRVAR
jgi:hypothetical protein